MLNDNAKKGLDKFIKYVVQQSKSNLTRKDKNVNKKLYNSIKGGVSVYPRSFTAYIEMEEYGEFVDKGVKGKASSAKAPNSPFRFGSGTGRKGGLTDGINSWVVKRRIQFRNKQTNKFMSYKQTANLIIRSVFNEGIKPSEFFSKPLETGFKRLPDEIVQLYGLDVDTFLKDLVNNGKKNWNKISRQSE